MERVTRLGKARLSQVSGKWQELQAVTSPHLEVRTTASSAAPTNPFKFSLDNFQHEPHIATYTLFAEPRLAARHRKNFASVPTRKAGQPYPHLTMSKLFRYLHHTLTDLTIPTSVKEIPLNFILKLQWSFSVLLIPLFAFSNPLIVHFANLITIITAPSSSLITSLDKLSATLIGFLTTLITFFANLTILLANLISLIGFTPKLSLT